MPKLAGPDLVLALSADTQAIWQQTQASFVAAHGR